MRLGDIGRAVPMHLGGIAEAGADGMNMGIDQAGNHGAAIEVDDFCRGPRQLAHRIGAARRGNAASLDGERLADLVTCRRG